MRQPNRIESLSDEHRWILHQGHRVYVAYVTTGSATKPYVSTLAAPSGRNLLADAPHDHIHHHGIWWGHGDVNGVSFYLELPRENPGRIEHREWAEQTLNDSQAGFLERLAWVAPSGETMIEETRRLTATFGREDGYLLDLDSEYVAQTDIRFGATKESALPIIRVADAFNGKSGGVIVNSEGQRGEQATFGQPARWVDYTAPVPEAHGAHGREGLACLDHPTNPHHPNKWFTREYGPLSPREGNLFVGEETLGKGDPLRLRHRIVVHAGDEKAADIEAAWQEYAAE